MLLLILVPNGPGLKQTFLFVSLQMRDPRAIIHLLLRIISWLKCLSLLIKLLLRYECLDFLRLRLELGRVVVVMLLHELLLKRIILLLQRVNLTALVVVHIVVVVEAKWVVNLLITLFFL